MSLNALTAARLREEAMSVASEAQFLVEGVMVRDRTDRASETSGDASQADRARQGARTFVPSWRRGTVRPDGSEASFAQQGARALARMCRSGETTLLTSAADSLRQALRRTGFPFTAFLNSVLVLISA
jgi:hypothetical protein